VPPRCGRGRLGRGYGVESSSQVQDEPEYEPQRVDKIEAGYEAEYNEELPPRAAARNPINILARNT
jgi:hypothetical protein